MQFHRLAALTLGAAVLASVGTLAIAQEMPSSQQTEVQPAHGGLRHFLTPEERIMWRQQHRADVKSMSTEQRQAYRQQLRQQFAAMNPQQRDQMRDQLQAQWNQLPQQRQQQIEQRIAERQQNVHGQHAHQHSGAYSAGQQGANQDND
jgi:hypothetical protein